MHGKFFVLRVAAAAVLLPGAIAMPAEATELSTADDSASNSAPNLQPADASTPTAASSHI